MGAFRAARLSPNNRRLYWGGWNSHIQCIDLGTSQALWEKESLEGVTSLDISPDGRVLASASGFGRTTIQIWDTATGERLRQLEGHTLWVSDLAFTRDGRRLFSAAGDQTIRGWDTITWTESQEPLCGHADEAWAIAISEAAQRIASVSRDGDLKLWRMDGKRAADGYRRLLESPDYGDVRPLDRSRMLLLPPGHSPELLDLKRDSPPVSLPGIGSSDNVLGCYDINLICVWNVINGPLGANLFSNGSFSNGLSAWVAEQHEDARASFTSTFDFTNHQPSVKVSVTNAGASGWHIQLNYPNLKLASNLVYTISFAAKAAPAAHADVAVSQAYPDWRGLGYYRSLSLTTNWQWFTNTFQLSASDTNARINFSSMGDKLATFWFADVRLRAGTNQTNQILIGELRGAEFVPRGAITLHSGVRPAGLAYNPARRLLAWSEGASSRSLYLASLGKSNWAASRRIELTNDVPGLVPIRFSEDGKYLAAAREPDILRTWNVETGQNVTSINKNFSEEEGVHAAQRTGFAANGSVLVVARHHRVREEIEFYNLARPNQAPRRVPGGFAEQTLAVSPDGELVAASNLGGGQVLLFDAAVGKSIGSFQGHLNSIGGGIAFAPDGRRLISADEGREAIKLWDVGTRQELLTLAGANAILTGPLERRRQRDPRWPAVASVDRAVLGEIAAAEAKDPPSSRLGRARKGGA
ncbi:MAG: carbohydrate binding domain-containing protein [Verrucomicrobiota bacterium]